MDRSKRRLEVSVAQTYETSIHDRRSGRSFSFVVVPARSIQDDVTPSADRAMRLLGMDRPPDGAGPPSFIDTWALPFAIDVALGRDWHEIYQERPLFWEDPFRPRGRRSERLGPSAFAQHLAYAPVVPFESSPLGPKSLSDIAAAGGGIGGALGAYITGDPLLLLTVPAGIVVCGAARGVSQALEIGLRARLLDLMGVEDPDAAGAREPAPDEH